MGIFKGIRTKNGAFVTYDDTPLDLRLDLKNHSPMGFEWGYNGSGPRQLALAMIAKLTYDKNALEHYKEFAKVFIEPLNKDEWSFDTSLLKKWIYERSLQLQGFFIVDREIFLDDKCIGRIDFHDKGEVLNINCSFMEISKLSIMNIPRDIHFEIVDKPDNRYAITENLYLQSLISTKYGLYVNFLFELDSFNYKGKDNPSYVIENFMSNLKKIDSMDVSSYEINERFYNICFAYKDTNILNNQDIKSYVMEISELILKGYENSSINKNFEATFNFPEEYQSILKPYMLYFEEFLNDFCIESDVSIYKEGLNTILSVEPKNKDEALEKIADALKLYISAPVLASDVTLDEKLQMQTALQKLHAQCTHLESQLVLKTATLNEQNKQLQVQQKVIDRTKNMLIEAGVNSEKVNVNNIMLIDSLQEVKFNKKSMKSDTFWSSIKTSIQIPLVFKASLEINREQKKDK